MEKPKGVVVGQKITSIKKEVAKELRQQMTPEEKLLWQQLRTNKLAGLHFRRQQLIEGFIADFYCHSAGLVIELDGPIHNPRHDYDAERDKILQARNLRVLRFTNEEIRKNLPSVLQRILAECQK